jgi:hypothetical protein
MNQNGSITLFHYWIGCVMGALPEAFGESSPPISSRCSDTFILERDTRGEAVFRLAGTRLLRQLRSRTQGLFLPPVA